MAVLKLVPNKVVISAPDAVSAVAETLLEVSAVVTAILPAEILLDAIRFVAFTLLVVLMLLSVVSVLMVAGLMSQSL